MSPQSQKMDLCAILEPTDFILSDLNSHLAIKMVILIAFNYNVLITIIIIYTIIMQRFIINLLLTIVVICTSLYLYRPLYIQALNFSHLPVPTALPCFQPWPWLPGLLGIICSQVRSFSVFFLYQLIFSSIFLIPRSLPAWITRRPYQESFCQLTSTSFSALSPAGCFLCFLLSLEQVDLTRTESHIRVKKKKATLSASPHPPELDYFSQKHSVDVTYPTGKETKPHMPFGANY